MKIRTILAAALATTAAFTGCSGAQSAKPIDANAPLKVAVSPVPHGEILTFIADGEGKDLNLQVVEFTDYVQPNEALNAGDVSANYFQTGPYLDEQSKSRGYDFAVVKSIHLEPLGLYSKKVKSLNDLKEGDHVAIPNDGSNEGRALQLLAANGLITLKDTGGQAPTPVDIDKNEKKLVFDEVEAAQLPRSLDDVAAAVINGNYAIGANLNPAKDAIALEKAEGNKYTNLLVVKKGNENDERIKKLSELLCSAKTKKFIEDKYQGSVIPAC